MRAGAAVFVLALLSGVAPAFAAGGGGHGFALKEHGFYVLNFLIFVGIFVVFARKPLLKGLADRAESFARRLDEARKLHEATQAQLGEARDKVAGLDAERVAVLQRMEAEAVRQKEAIAEKTVSESEKIRAGAKNALENEKSRLERQVQADLALASLDRAEEQLAEQWPSLPHGAYAEQFADALGEQPTTDGGQ